MNLVGDPLRLGQVLLNLINNAIKFTQSGGVELSIRAAAARDGKVELTFAIRDTGIGISDPQRQRLFQKFTQAESSTTRRFGGSGLGLAISKQIVELMGGEIGVKSELGAGSTFTFPAMLGLRPGAAEQAAAARPAGEFRGTMAPPGASTAPRVAVEIQGAHVLVVDDNEINQQVAVEILGNAGVTADVAGNGRIAVEQVLANPRRYDAILMDIQMPVMDGLDAAREIHKTLGPGDLPIIALTAHAMERERARGREAGFDAHVSKPINTAVLVDVLNRLIKPRADIGIGRELQSVTPSAALPQLPEALPPFDIAATLLRLNGNSGLLRRLIISFAKGYCDSLPTLRRHLANGEREKAHRLVHSVKGVAGNLEAAALEDCAEKLEAALHDAHSEARENGVADLVNNFERAMGEALDAADRMRNGDT